MSGYSAVRRIYQLGDVVVHKHVEDFSELELQTKGTTLSIQDSHMVLFAESGWRPQLPVVRLRMLLYNDGTWSDGQILQRLLNQQGHVIDIYAYEQVKTPLDLRGCDCGCDCDECCECRMIWMQAKARISNIRVVAVQANRVYRLELSFEYATYWQPINRLLYGVSDKLLDFAPWYSQDWGLPARELMNYPPCEALDSCPYFYRKPRNQNSILYDDQYYMLLHDFTGDSQYPLTGYTHSYTTGSINYKVESPAWRWGAPALSQYFIRGFESSTGTIEVEVLSESLTGPRSNVSTLDIDEVLNIAASQSITVLPTDIIVLGDNRLGPKVVRGDQDLFYIAPAVTIEAVQWFGQINPGRNYVQYDLGNTGVEVGAVHTFRRL